MRKRDVVNMALDYLGIDAVDYNSSEATAPEKRLGRQYDVASLYVLQQTDWIDAIDHTTLTTEAAGTNVFDDYWDYMYDLPSDWLKTLDIDLDNDAKYIVEGLKLYTNLYNASTGIDMRYVKDIRAESNNSLLYSEMLAEVIATRLAYLIAPIAQKGAFLETFDQVLAEAIRTNDQQERWAHGHDGAWWTDVDKYRQNPRRSYERYD